MNWTPATIFARLVEAAEVIAATTARDGPQGFDGYWPETADPHDYPKGITTRFRPDAAQVSRAYQVQVWLTHVGDDLTRRMLMHRAAQVASGDNWSRTCRKMRWKRTTANSRIAKALEHLATKLHPVCRAGDMPSSRHLRQIEGIFARRSDTVEKCATETAWIADEARTSLEHFGTDPDPGKWSRERKERLRRKALGAEIEEEFS